MTPAPTVGAPGALPLVTPDDLVSWCIVAPLAVLVLQALEQAQAGRFDEAQQTTALAFAVCVAGLTAVLLWGWLGAAVLGGAWWW